MTWRVTPSGDGAYEAILRNRRRESSAGTVDARTQGLGTLPCDRTRPVRGTLPRGPSHKRAGRSVRQIRGNSNPHGRRDREASDLPRVPIGYVHVICYLSSIGEKNKAPQSPFIQDRYRLTSHFEETRCGFSGSVATVEDAAGHRPEEATPLQSRRVETLTGRRAHQGRKSPDLRFGDPI